MAKILLQEIRQDEYKDSARQIMSRNRAMWYVLKVDGFVSFPKEVTTQLLKANGSWPPYYLIPFLNLGYL